nr:hypothetical protein [Corynebacterium glutamicum]
MSFLNSAKTKTVAFTATFVGAATLATPAIASADIIDNALAALPSGGISCSQAESTGPPKLITTARLRRPTPWRCSTPAPTDQGSSRTRRRSSKPLWTQRRHRSCAG